MTGSTWILYPGLSVAHARSRLSKEAAMARSEEMLSIPCGNIRLEGVLKVCESARGCAVITHPHPVYGGNMDNPVVRRIEASFRDAGYTTLRFNFRGTCGSSGEYDDGKGEQQDVRSCLAYLKERFDLPVTLAGYSFGSWVNARLLNSGLLNTSPLDTNLFNNDEPVQNHIMVAPPVAFLSFSTISHIPCTRLVVTGELDEIAPPRDVHAMVARCASSAHIDIIPGGDHFYSETHLAMLYGVLYRHLAV